MTTKRLHCFVDDRIDPASCFKVGEMFTLFGPEFVREL